MKNCLLVFSLLVISIFGCTPEDYDHRYLDKVQTIDSTIENLYAVISGPSGQARDWNLFRYLFKPGAQLIPSGQNAEGEISCKFMSPAEYVQTSGKWLEENGFFEKEIARNTQTFSNITQVWSTYAATKTATDEKPFMRGINSIQLLNDGKRWWIVNIYWINENEEFPLPPEFL